MHTFAGVGMPATPFYCVRARAREDELTDEKRLSQMK